jgi:hypothetical protein
MELYSVESERVVIKALIQLPDFTKSIFLNSKIKPEYFADLFHRDAFESIRAHFNRHYCAPPDERTMRNELLPNITRVPDRYKDESAQRRIWTSSVKRLFVSLSAQEEDSLDSHLETVDVLFRKREIQQFLVTAEKEFERGNIDNITASMQETVLTTLGVENTVMEGDIVSDLRQHVQILRQQRSGEFQPIKCHIAGAMENHSSGDYKKVYLDDPLEGGAYAGEMIMYIGENNVGKSFALMEHAYSGARDGRNVALFTIEMNKIKEERRLYSRMTGIPYYHFKRGTLTRGHLDQLKKRLYKWKHESGLLYVASFDNGLTVPELAAKLQEIQLRKEVFFDMVVVDYLNDMSPVKNIRNGDKSWEAMGEISWGLASLAKYWNNHKGISVITANQKKSASAGRAKTDWQDAAYGTIVTQHATVGIGLGQDETDKAIGRIKWDLWKARDGEKGQTFYTYPDFAVSKIASRQRLEEYYDTRDDGKEEEDVDKE